MNKFQNLTNQELLKQLEKRLPDFTLNEIAKLSELIMTDIPHHYKEKSLGIIKETSPQLYDSIQETVQQIEKENTDKQVAQIKKILDKNPEKK